MTSVTQFPPEQATHPWKQGLKKVLLSRWTFVALQAFDLATTLLVFRIGGEESNPIVAHLAASFGRFNGVLISKVIAITIAMGVRKRLWIINIFYAAIIAWNALVLIAMSLH